MGNTAPPKLVLNKVAKLSAIAGADSFNIRADIPSGPVALLIFNDYDCTVSRIDLAVMGTELKEHHCVKLKSEGLTNDIMTKTKLKNDH